MSADGGAGLRSFPHRFPLAATLVPCALLGAALGLLYPSLEVAIEPAQILAGLVEYPADNPFGFYERRLWTVWHQLLAPLLAAGVDERTLSLGVSAAVGALAFLALGAFAFACGAPPLLAVAAPLLTWALNPYLGWGFNYPILLIGYAHTYGMAGLSWSVLAVSLLGAERWAAGALLLGFAPAVHASLGAWAAVLTGLVGLASWREIRPHLPRIVAGGAAGVALSGASFAFHAATQPAPPWNVDPIAIDRHLDVFMRLWDAHRAPLDLLEWRTLLFAIGVALAVALLRRGVAARGSGRALLLRVHLACAAAGLVFALSAELPPDAIPTALLVAMPGRLANVPMFAWVALVVGACGALRRDPLWRWPVAALVGVALLWSRAHWLLTFGVPAIGLAVVALALAGGRDRGRDALSRWSARHGRAMDRAIACGLVVGFGWVLALSVRSHPKLLAGLRDRSNDTVCAAAASSDGVLLVAPTVSLAQLRTRRPLLLDPNALDMLPYAPAAGPALAQIVDEVYGLDFFAPPAQALHRATVPELAVRGVWEERSPAEWSALAARFGFRDVITPAGWTLALPVVARNERFAFYRLPASEVRSGESGSPRRTSARTPSTIGPTPLAAPKPASA
jgi:hypothetical protein